MAKPGETVLKIIERVDGKPTEHDGKYVVEYDPTLTWCEIVADRTCKLVTSADIDEALGFKDAGVAFECWRQVCPNITAAATTGGQTGR